MRVRAAQTGSLALLGAWGGSVKGAEVKASWLSSFKQIENLSYIFFLGGAGK